ncbi:MAG: hypothetical protein WDW38_003401 [Sanguina aurantia]
MGQRWRVHDGCGAVSYGLFGHLFAKGETREAAIRAMVVALRDVVIRGEIRTNVDYTLDMLTSPDFVSNHLNTGWLDARIAAHVKGSLTLPWHLTVIAGAVVRAAGHVNARRAEYLGYLTKGQLPPARLSLVTFSEKLVIDGFKYNVSVTRRSPTTYNVELGAPVGKASPAHRATQQQQQQQQGVDVIMRQMAGGGFLMQLDGESHMVHLEEEAMGTRLLIGSTTVLLCKESDPSRLVASSPGKLVRQLVAPGSRVQINTPYAELEVMKMLMPLLTPAPGLVNFVIPEGSVVAAGELIARLTLDPGTEVVQAQPFTGSLPDIGPPQIPTERLDHVFKAALEAAHMIMAGYPQPVDSVVNNLMLCMDSPALALLKWTNEYTVVRSKLPSTLAAKLDAITAEHEQEVENYEAASQRLALQPPCDFPSQVFMDAVQRGIEEAPAVERPSLALVSEPLVAVAKQHGTSREAFARRLVTSLLEQFLDVEERFQLSGEATTEQEVVDALRKEHSGELAAVLDLVMAHQGLQHRAELASRLMLTLVLPSPAMYRPQLRRLAQLAVKGTEELGQRARHLLEQSLLADLRSVVARALSGLDMFSSDGGLDGIVSPPPGEVRQRGVPGGAPSSAEKGGGVERRVTVMEGLFKGLQTNPGAAPGAAAGQARSRIVPWYNACLDFPRTGCVRFLRRRPVCAAQPRTCIGRLDSAQPSGDVGPTTPLAAAARRSRGSGGARGSITAAIENKMEQLVGVQAAVEEALASLLVDCADSLLQTRAMVTYVRRVYSSCLLRDPFVQTDGGGILMCVWLYEDPAHDTRTSEGPQPAASLRTTSSSSGGHRVGAMLLVHQLDDVSPGLTLLAAFLDSLDLKSKGGTLHISLAGDESLRKSSEAVDLVARAHQAASPKSRAADTAALELVASQSDLVGVLNGQQHGDQGIRDGEFVAQVLEAVVLTSLPIIRSMSMTTVSLLGQGPTLLPVRDGYTWDAQEGTFGKQRFMRHVEPPVSALLELPKLASYSHLHYSPSRNRQWHMYGAQERADTRSLPLQKLYVRGLVRCLGQPALLAASYSGNSSAVATAAVQELDDTLAGCLVELNRPQARAADSKASSQPARPDWTHLFFSVLPPLPLQPGPRTTHASPLLCALQQQGLLSSTAWPCVPPPSPCGRSASGVSCMTTPGGWWCLCQQMEKCAVFWSDPCPGHEQGDEHVEVYREMLGSASQGHLYSAVLPEVAASSQHAAVQPLSRSPLHGLPILSGYPPLALLQRKRLAARRHSVTYAYDFPTVFGNALREVWAARAAAGEPNSFPPAGRLVEVEELVLPSNPDGSVNSNFRSPGKMLRVTRPIGGNTCGMVAWIMHLKTPECPQGRQVVAVANDITWQSGAFSPSEDALFRAATELSLEERLPLIYLAANSGARVGLALEVRDLLQVAWVKEDDPSQGLRYLYLEDADYQRLLTQGSAVSLKSVNAQRLEEGGGVRWVLRDVIGLEDGLGVECLSGSGAIASAFARAFREGYTITLVSGRTVGIGAYLARLGRRCVQRADQPIILTGYAALNKLLARTVYTSHMQLGGPRVMGVNGVSHHLVADDLEGARRVLAMLAFAPPETGSGPANLLTSDPTSRQVTYLPAGAEKFDPRSAFAGVDRSPPAAPPALPAASLNRPGAAPVTSDASSGWQSGMFDAGSWMECQSGWARTVVTGRARLGGFAVGVIGVEATSVTRHIPADPGMPESSETNILQAGQVWYPDSADKTAAAMEEFDLEQLPLFILANWRGFSGGQRDLFDGILQAGSLIVERLRTYKQPVFVYIPCGAELRGGAWVVVDSQINAAQVEMYADPTARGGVLEPEGVVEIKFRSPDLLKMMHRIDPKIRQLRAEAAPGFECAVKAREGALLPVFQQVARTFADMHDTPQRMMAKGVLAGVVPWQQCRSFFATRLRCRLVEQQLLRHVASTDPTMPRDMAVGLIHSWHASASTHWSLISPSRMTSQVSGSLSLCEGHPRGTAMPLPRAQAQGSEEGATHTELQERDCSFLEWAESGAGRAHIGGELKSMRSRAAAQMISQVLGTAEGKEGMLKALQAAVQQDPVLALQIKMLLNEIA